MWEKINLHEPLLKKLETCKSGILLPKLFWPTVRKKISSDQEKLLKFEAEGREFAKFFRSLEQTVRTMFDNRMLFKLVPGGYSYLIN